MYLGIYITISSLTIVGFLHPEAQGTLLPLPKRSSDPIPKLRVTLRQTSVDPPNIVVTITNLNSKPITFSDVHSPFMDDPIIPGYLLITPEGHHEPLPHAPKAIWKLNPGGGEKIEIKPGKSKEHGFELRHPGSDSGDFEVSDVEDQAVRWNQELGANPAVQLHGKWLLVWWSDTKHTGTESFTGEFISSILNVTLT